MTTPSKRAFDPTEIQAPAVQASATITPSPTQVATAGELFLQLVEPAEFEVITDAGSMTVAGRTRVDAIVTINDTMVEPNIDGEFSLDMELEESPTAQQRTFQESRWIQTLSILLTFQAQVRPEDVRTILGHDPRSKNWRDLPPDLRKMYEHLQRVTSKDRRAGVTGYIEDRFSPDAYGIGAFPAICIGMTLPAAFQPLYADSPILGTLNLDLSASNVRLILDGLARLTGAMDLFEERDDLKTQEPPLFTFPVTFYAP